MIEPLGSTGLAVLGAPPAFSEPLLVGRPVIPPPDFERRLSGVFARRWFTNNGPEVRELEERIAAHLDVSHCVLVASGTTGLQIAARALELRGEVILPSFTFIATAHALSWLGLSPVFADVDATNHNLDPASVLEKITDRTSAILGVHLWGRPCPVRDLQALADASGVELLFDAAHAFSASHGGRMIGSFGTLEVLSFHATKFFHTAEGGAIVTGDPVLADRIRRMRDHGIAGTDHVVSLGTNGKMSELSAALGLANLTVLDELIAGNRRRHRRYVSDLAGIPGIEPLVYDEAERCNYQYQVVEVTEECPLLRDELQEVLTAENVLARRYFHPGCHRAAPYALDPADRLPITEGLCDRVLVLPSGRGISVDEITRVAGLIRSACDRVGQIRPMLAGRRSELRAGD